MQSPFDEKYWTERYRSDAATWDAGAITTPLKAYFDQLTDKGLAILIPGAGNAWEAEYLHRTGFTNVTVADISEDPLKNIRARVPSFPPGRLLQKDFFTLTGQYDLIVEQTFFCALHPSLRSAYARKVLDLLKPGGELAGVLFSTRFQTEGPPFGGTREEYMTYFEPLFASVEMEPCYNSIPPRTGRELFIRVKKS